MPVSGKEVQKALANLVALHNLGIIRGAVWRMDGQCAIILPSNQYQVLRCRGGSLIPPPRPQPTNFGFRINNQIRVPKVRLIGSNGTNLGVIDTREAMDMARREHLDLIEVAPNSDPPVCRIFDYGKFSYEREKKEREAKKTQRTFELKGVRLRPKTTDYHLYFKMREARRFLEQGNKVKVTLKFRGREDRLLHVARRMLDKVAEGCADLALLESAPNMEGKTMLVVLAPTQATLANAHLKTTQERVERELEEDKAVGYVEDTGTEDENDDVLDEETALKFEQAGSEIPLGPPPAQAHDVALREQKLKNRHKRRKDLSMEQFNLP